MSCVSASLINVSLIFTLLFAHLCLHQPLRKASDSLAICMLLIAGKSESKQSCEVWTQNDELKDTRMQWRAAGNWRVRRHIKIKKKSVPHASTWSFLPKYDWLLISLRGNKSTCDFEVVVLYSSTREGNYKNILWTNYLSPKIIISGLSLNFCLGIS